MRAEAEFLNDWLTRASKRSFCAQDVVDATATCAFHRWAFRACSEPLKLSPAILLHARRARPEPTRAYASLRVLGALAVFLGRRGWRRAADAITLR